MKDSNLSCSSLTFVAKKYTNLSQLCHLTSMASAWPKIARWHCSIEIDHSVSPNIHLWDSLLLALQSFNFCYLIFAQ